MGKQALKFLLRPLSALSLVVPMFGVLDEPRVARERGAVVLSLGEIGIDRLGKTLRAVREHRLASRPARDRDRGEHNVVSRTPRSTYSQIERRRSSKSPYAGLAA
jgi:hypothetical protein